MPETILEFNSRILCIIIFLVRQIIYMEKAKEPQVGEGLCTVTEREQMVKQVRSRQK